MYNSLWCYKLCSLQFLCPWGSLGKNTGVGSHSLLWGNLPAQGLNPGLQHSWQILYHLSYKRRFILYCALKHLLRINLILSVLTTNTHTHTHTQQKQSHWEVRRKLLEAKDMSTLIVVIVLGVCVQVSTHKIVYIQ